MRKECLVEGCERIAQSRGMCATHYMRWWKTGDVGSGEIRGYQAQRICKQPDCNKPATARDMCPMHYQRWRIHGDATVTLTRRRDDSATVEEWFWRRADRRGPKGCWLWTGGINSAGYGLFSLRGRMVAAHRYSYELAHGPIPAGAEIDHVYDRGCRHRHCVNPAHLEAVDHRENMRRSVTAAPGVRARSDRCVNGHLYDDANTMIDKQGHRRCRACRRARHQRWLDRQVREA